MRPDRPQRLHGHGQEHGRPARSPRGSACRSSTRTRRSSAPTGKRIPDLWRDEGEALVPRARGGARRASSSRRARRGVIAFGGGTVTVRAHAAPRARSGARRHAHRLARDHRRARPRRWPARPNLAVGGDPVARATELLADAGRGVRRVPPVAVERGARRGRRWWTPSCALRRARSRCSCPSGRAATPSTSATDDAVAPDRRGRAAGAVVGRARDRLERATCARRGDRGRASPARRRRHARDAAAGRATQDARQRVDHLGRGARRGRRPRRARHRGRAAASWATSRASPRRACSAACASCRCRRRCSRWSTPRSAARPGSTIPPGKNLVGAFHQPSGVVADLAHLDTLPARERRRGLAEVVKIALATDAALLARLERDAAAIAARRARGAAAGRPRRPSRRRSGWSATTSARPGRRALLNLGHTVGHALEAHGGYCALAPRRGRRAGHGGRAARDREAAGLHAAGACCERAEALLAALGLADPGRGRRARCLVALRGQRQEACARSAALARGHRRGTGEARARHRRRSAACTGPLTLRRLGSFLALPAPGR